MVESKELEDTLNTLRSRVQKQGDIVRDLKSRQAPDMEIKYALAELKARKKLLEEKEIQLQPPVLSFDRAKLEDLLKQRFFYDQSFAIYGGVQGLYDYGPMGCSMKANLIQAWRQHFILEDQLLEVDCSMLTPAPVLQASGHVERFTDLMVKDTKTGECFRADHLVKSVLESKLKQKKTSDTEKEEINKILVQLDNYGAKELDAIIHQYNMRAPVTNNDLSEPQEFNLMFATMIGPTGQYKGYLRPETAQGIFVNFQRLLQFNQGRIPFGAAQIGSAFRNEISPRSGLIRVREFAMAEIEYFVDPRNKNHPKFADIKDVEMTLYSACDQMDGKPTRRITIGEAVEQGIVENETLGYFMARINLFLKLVGIDPSRLRFRQHLSNEMAHYACDCWDAECQTSYGWIECVGCADRSCFDLKQHTKATGTRLVAEKRLTEPHSVLVTECVTNKQIINKTFRADAKSIRDRLSALSLDETTSMSKSLSNDGHAELIVDGKPFEITSEMVSFKEKQETVYVEEIVPNVIEPSFGIGRILYAVFEHSFRMRDGDEKRTYLSVSPILAPYKCSVLPLSSHPDFIPFIRQLANALTRVGVSHRVDESSGSIGRRYARTDQIAIPYGITIDFDTVNKTPASATLRERDSMRQIRVPLTDLPTLVSELANHSVSWTDAQSRYPAFEQQETGSSAPAQSPTAQHEDWQSVSEDLEEGGRVVVGEHDNWTSATETGELEVAAEPKKIENPKSKRQGQNATGKRAQLVNEADPSAHVISPPNNGGLLETEPTFAKTCADHSGKKPISWSDWGKAVRKHYQEEEARDKCDGFHHATPTSGHPVSSNATLDLDESNSFLSGYEADQEDNAITKSTSGGLLSPDSKELNTPMKPRTDEQNLIDHHSIEASSKPTVPTNLDTEFPPLNGNAVPNHGLFVGHGWPGNKGTRSEPPPVRLSHAQVDQPDQIGESWPGVMSKVFDKTGEFDSYSSPLENIFVYSQLDAGKISESTTSPGMSDRNEPTQLSHTKSADVPDNHGLFTGSGWPTVKTVKPKESQKVIAPREMLSKPDSGRLENSLKDLSAVRETVYSDGRNQKSDQAKVANDWRTVIAQINETVITMDSLPDELAFNLHKYNHEGKLNQVIDNGTEGHVEVDPASAQSKATIDQTENLMQSEANVIPPVNASPISSKKDLNKSIGNERDMSLAEATIPVDIPLEPTQISAVDSVPVKKDATSVIQIDTHKTTPGSILADVATAVSTNAADEKPSMSSVPAVIDATVIEEASPDPVHGLEAKSSTEQELAEAALSGDASGGDTLGRSKKNKNKRRRPKKKK